ncbi:hypothetical protein I9Y33_002655 [Clostridium perfringens]|nr:hypothetical protein [Clostridium perfringens]EGT0014760.1 hypothetical protein [Clostridium perfringens]
MSTYNLNFLKEFLAANFLGNTETTKNIRNSIVKKTDLITIERVVITINEFLKDDSSSEEHKKELIVNNCTFHLKEDANPLAWLKNLEQSLMKVLFNPKAPKK